MKKISVYKNLKRFHPDLRVGQTIYNSLVNKYDCGSSCEVGDWLFYVPDRILYKAMVEFIKKYRQNRKEIFPQKRHE